MLTLMGAPVLHWILLNHLQKLMRCFTEMAARSRYYVGLKIASSIILVFLLGLPYVRSGDDYYTSPVGVQKLIKGTPVQYSLKFSF